MKKIFLCHASRNLHSIYRNMVKEPPKGYEFILPEKTAKTSVLNFLLSSIFIKKIYRNTLKKVLPTHRFYSDLAYSSFPEDADLALAFTTIEEEIPYVLDLPENPYSITGYNYKLFMNNLEKINKDLSKSNCKAIIVPFKDCYDMCKKYFNKDIMEKVFKIRFSFKSRPFIKKNKDKITFLLVGSLTNPEDFEIKGGLEVLESFSKLRRKYGGKVELVIKCNVPKNILKKQDLDGVIILDKILSVEEMDNLYSSSHVMLAPSHNAVAMTPLEGISYSMPLIAIDVFGAGEYVKHGENGFLVKKSKKIPYNSIDYPCNIRSKEFLTALRNPDKTVVNEMYSFMKRFVDNPELIDKMGRFSLNLLNRNFSVEKRKKQLKQVFDFALK